MNIAMWSGPRNLSTAMMYAFASRPDFEVWDEPFYAPWLAATGAVHPLRSEILARHDTDPTRVARLCGQASADGAAHVYQKHMIHHMLDAFDLDWAAQCRHVFLLRHPVRVVASYAAKRENPSADDLGFARQEALFDQLAQLTGNAPLVIDSADIRAAPGPMLQALCAALDIGYDPAMLSWSHGGHPWDGAWAPHWYGAVHRSTGFAGPEGPLPVLSPAMARLAAEGLPGYVHLAALRLAV